MLNFKVHKKFINEFVFINYFESSQIYELSRRKWSPTTTGPPDHLRVTNCVAVDGPPDQVYMASMDGPL